MKKFTLIFMIALFSLSILFTACKKTDMLEEANHGSNPSQNITEITSDTDSHTQKETDDGSSTSEKTTASASDTDSSVPSTDTKDTQNTQNTQTSHTHSYGTWKTVTEATCKQSGTKERVCSCGKKETQTIAVIAHNYVNDVCSMCNQKDPNAFVPDYSPGQANVVGNDCDIANYATQAGYLYFSSNQKKIDKIKTDRTNLQTVYKVMSGSILNVNVVGDWIYFYCKGTTVEKSYIAKVRTDGSNFQKIVSSVNVLSMLVAKDTLYYTTSTADGKYKDFGKDVYPLYSVSVKGGTPKQIYDGAVIYMVADASYLYFVHNTERGKATINRIKHGSTSSSVLLSGKEIFNFTLENSKLYFFVINKYDDICSLASISTNGGSYTEYGKVMQYTDTLYVVGNKAYYMGSRYMEEEFCEQAGLVEYNLTTKTDRIIREEYEVFGFMSTGDFLIFENYDYNTKKLKSFTIYYAKTNVFKEVKLS